MKLEFLSPFCCWQNNKLWILSTRSSVVASFICLTYFPPSFFTPQDLEIVYSYLHGMEALSNLREHQLRSVFRTPASSDIRSAFPSPQLIRACRVFGLLGYWVIFGLLHQCAYEFEAVCFLNCISSEILSKLEGPILCKNSLNRFVLMVRCD